jgi:Xaa-Pro aminopeptidase
MHKKAKQIFKDTNVDAIILRTSPACVDPNFFYFSGVLPGVLNNNAILLSPRKKPLLLRTVLDPEINVSGLRIKTVKRRKQVEATLNKELSGKRIGINAQRYTVDSLKRLKKALPGKRFVDISKQLSTAREIKEPWEISRILKATKITEKALNDLSQIFKKGITESQLALKLEFLLRERSKDNVAFSPIVANARNSSFPHHFPSERKIKKGVVLVDCGAKVKGYCADLTRMFTVGKPSKKEKALYETVFEAKRLGQELSVEGSIPCNVFKQVSDFLKRNAGQALIHGLGHGLGLETHDSPPGFLRDIKQPLKAGMVLTVEPAVYTKGFGVRIEDDIVVKKGKFRALSTAPKQLIPLR